MSRVRTLVATEFLMLAGLLAYVGLAYGMQLGLALDRPVRLNAVSALLMSGVPALLWLGYFYSQDRLEPEPKSHVLGCYILGAFVAGPSAHFLVEVALTPSETVSFQALAVERWIAAIAIVGIAQEVCKYAVVRYTLYTSPEFDEPLDGIIYMSAAGIGFASYECVQSLRAEGGEIYLSVAAAQCVVTTLAHASFAGVLGFALGRAKFSAARSMSRSLHLVAGLLCAAILNGGFHMILDALSVQGLTSSPWPRVFFSFGFAAAVFLLTSLLIRMLDMESPHRSPDDETHKEAGDDA